jgi:hypothetical protein
LFAFDLKKKNYKDPILLKFQTPKKITISPMRTKSTCVKATGTLRQQQKQLLSIYFKDPEKSAELLQQSIDFRKQCVKLQKQRHKLQKKLLQIKKQEVDAKNKAFGLLRQVKCLEPVGYTAEVKVNKRIEERKDERIEEQKDEKEVDETNWISYTRIQTLELRTLFAYVFDLEDGSFHYIYFDKSNSKLEGWEKWDSDEFVQADYDITDIIPIWNRKQKKIKMEQKGYKCKTDEHIIKYRGIYYTNWEYHKHHKYETDDCCYYVCFDKFGRQEAIYQEDHHGRQQIQGKVCIRNHHYGTKSGFIKFHNDQSHEDDEMVDEYTDDL